MAKAIFDAAEQAQVEAIGANQMAGVKQDLATVLNEATKADIGAPESGDDSALAEAVGLIVRETLTGKTSCIYCDGDGFMAAYYLCKGRGVAV